MKKRFTFIAVIALLVAFVASCTRFKNSAEISVLFLNAEFLPRCYLQ